MDYKYVAIESETFEIVGHHQSIDRLKDMIKEWGGQTYRGSETIRIYELMQEVQISKRTVVNIETLPPKLVTLAHLARCAVSGTEGGSGIPQAAWDILIGLENKKLDVIFCHTDATGWAVIQRSAKGPTVEFIEKREGLDV